jgi:hypothetical protein
MPEKNPEIDTEELKQKAKEDPKSKKWNNPNSRKNLKQYQDPPIVPEIVFQPEDEGDAESQAEEITRGRKLSPELVKKLVPKRGILTPTEKKRYNGIVTTFLSDFKNEEPTASDVDDILEIALCDVLEMRLLEASKNDPAVLVGVSQSVDRIHKRKQAAKENLATRRSDRKDIRGSQELNIVDLVVRHDLEQQRRDRARVDSLLQEEKDTQAQLDDVIKGDNF